MREILFRSERIEAVANHLIDSGLVIVLPCKVGDAICEVVGNEIIITHSFQQQWRIARYLEEGIFGVYAFLTKEEAEARLEELKNEQER